MITVHTLCGLKVVSDLPLPDLLPWTGDDRAPDVAIRHGEVPARLDAPVIDGPLLKSPETGPAGSPSPVSPPIWWKAAIR